MQKMSFPKPSHTSSINRDEPSNDTVESPYRPLLDSANVEPPAIVPPRRRRRTTTVVLRLMTGLLGIGLLVVVVLITNGDNGDREELLPPGDDTSRQPEKVRAAARGVEEGVSAKTYGPTLGARKYQWTNRLLDWQRTAYHFQPKKNWMNDPNGPLFYNGWYHLFYQYNPYGPVWGDIVWGHAASKDLIHWRHLPAAMIADQWYDINGVWTGSATVLEDGQIVMLYTGSTNDSIQVQNLAYPADPSDPLLTKWVKYSGNPVLFPPPGVGLMDFRDPTTAWLTPQGKWRLIIGSKINSTGISLVFDTKDFKTFELLNGVLHAVPGTGMWECVDFFPVSEVGKDGLDTSVIGPTVKHVVKTSLDDDRNDYYALGTYDAEAGIWTPDDPMLDVGIGLRYDYGIFYASKTFYDPEKKRRVLWGWIKETDSEEADMRRGWASLQAIPRTILFDTKTGSNLLQWPVKEVERLRLNKKVFDKVKVNTGSVVHLDVGSTSQVDIVAEFEVDDDEDAAAFERIIINNGTDDDMIKYYNCSSSGGAAERGAFGPFGLLLFANDDLTEQTPVYFYISKDRQGNIKTFFCADHSRSSEATDVDKAIYGSTVSVLKGEKLSMRILVDHSIVESFAQGGRTCITSRIYPTKAIHEDARIFLFNNATDVRITASLKIWQMTSSACTISWHTSNLLVGNLSRSLIQLVASRCIWTFFFIFVVL